MPVHHHEAGKVGARQERANKAILMGDVGLIFFREGVKESEATEQKWSAIWRGKRAVCVESQAPWWGSSKNRQRKWQQEHRTTNSNLQASKSESWG